jgi:hypothetical protein
VVREIGCALLLQTIAVFRKCLLGGRLLGWRTVRPSRRGGHAEREEDSEQENESAQYARSLTDSNAESSR